MNKFPSLEFQIERTGKKKLPHPFFPFPLPSLFIINFCVIFTDANLWSQMESLRPGNPKTLMR